MIKPLTQKGSVEISHEGINNNDIKNNACDERAAATTLLKLIKTYAIHEIALL